MSIKQYGLLVTSSEELRVITRDKVGWITPVDYYDDENRPRGLRSDYHTKDWYLDVYPFILINVKEKGKEGKGDNVKG